jgi:ribosomal protein L11 methylase PrmA
LQCHYRHRIRGWIVAVCSALASSKGANRVIGFDFDHGASNKAFARGDTENLKFQPLFLDAANQSPDQGWLQSERRGLQARAKADAILALAFEHHLAIGRNVPVAQVVDWLTSLAPLGVIEFVEKTDPTIQQMLALREDIFPNYTLDAFQSALLDRAHIVKEEVVSATGRRLFWYDKK